MQKEQRRMRPEREAAEGYMRIRKAYIRTLTALLALALGMQAAGVGMVRRVLAVGSAS